MQCGEPTLPKLADDDKAWLVVRLFDRRGIPVAGAEFRLVFPDGTVIDGLLDGKGSARVEGVTPGTCRVTFPQFDDAPMA